MQKLTLHITLGDAASRFAMNVLDLCEISYTLQPQTKKTLYQKPFKTINPSGQLPFLQTSEKTGFSQATAIARWAARKSNKLYGTTNEEKAEVDQWLETVSNLVVSQVVGILTPVFGDLNNKAGIVDKKDCKKMRKMFVKSLEGLDRYLKKKEFLVGKSLSVADLYLVHELDTVFRLVLKPKLRKKVKNVVKYLKKRVNSEECSSLLRPLEFSDEKLKLVKYDLKKMAEEKKKAEAEAKAAKAAEKEAAKKAEALKKKATEFPKTKINLIPWKMYVVNEKDQEKKMKYIFENFEPEAWSFWKIDYDKLPTECKVDWETRNMVVNFLSRCDSFRKYTYGCLSVCGEPENYNIKGVWMWRGTEFLELLKDHPSWEYNKYTKLDPSKEEDKKVITEFFSATENDVDKVSIGGEVLRYYEEFK